MAATQRTDQINDPDPEGVELGRGHDRFRVRLCDLVVPAFLNHETTRKHTKRKMPRDLRGILHLQRLSGIS